MLYYLCKFSFTTAVHFGDSKSARSLENSKHSFCADTFFSALCHTALNMGGEDNLNKVYELSKSGNLLFSDAMPYVNEEFCIPKFITLSKKKVESDSDIKKKFKKMDYIPLSKINEYINFINGVGSFEPIKLEAGKDSTLVKVAIKGLKETEPYSMGLYNFNVNCGLYIIIGYNNTETLGFVKDLIKSLSYSGIGGKISSGYGKFVIDDEIELEGYSDQQIKELYKMLNNENATSFVSLTTALPLDSEINDTMENATYSLDRRAGFVQSFAEGSTPYKKRTQYFFSAGSVFKKKFLGDIYDVSDGETHPVYRYSRPLFLGVNL